MIDLTVFLQQLQAATVRQHLWLLLVSVVSVVSVVLLTSLISLKRLRGLLIEVLSRAQSIDAAYLLWPGGALVTFRFSLTV